MLQSFAVCSLLLVSTCLATSLAPNLTTFSVSAVDQATLPAPPEALTAQVSGNTVTLLWRPSAMGAPPTSYLLEASSAPGGPPIASAVVSGTSVTVPDVTNGVYYVTVRALNAYGASGPSDTAFVIVPEGGECRAAPLPPQALTATATGDLVTLSWRAPAGGCRATSFAVLAGSAPGASDITIVNVGHVTSVSASAPPATYYVRLVATNAFGASGASNEIVVVVGGTRCASAPLSPHGLTAHAVDGTLALEWSAPAGGCPPTSYTVHVGTSPGQSNVAIINVGGAHNLTTAVRGGTSYFHVIASNPFGTSAPSAPLTITGAAERPPLSLPPNHLRVMTWNIQFGRSVTQAMNVDAQVALMVDAGAHVIALQEVTTGPEVDLRVVYEAKLEALTGLDWTAVWAPGPRPSRATPEGNLLLTMLPVVSSSVFQYDSAPSEPSRYDTKRAAAHIGVLVNDLQINVFSTHLPVDASHRLLHVNALLEWVNRFPGPRVFGGDFNMPPGSTEYGAVARSFRDVWALLAPGDPGITKDGRDAAGGLPGRIDYWWQERNDPRLTANEVWLIKTTRSDHHALMIGVSVH
jgi:endonuclease/exonuclease/phosphatase family metal-dependent hydrolase